MQPSNHDAGQSNSALFVSIAERASYLSERSNGTFVPDETRTNDAPAGARLEQWRQLVADGDQAKFARRLAYDGLNPTTIRRVLGAVRLADGHPIPGWVHTLEAAVAASTAADRDRCLDAADPLPFEDVLWPFVFVARQRLQEIAGVGYRQLSDQAHLALERHLLRELSHIGARTFLSAFSVFRTMELPQTEAPQSAIRNLQSPIPNLQSAISNPQSAIPNPQSAIPHPQSAIPNPQSAVPNPKSAIRNPQSAYLAFVRELLAGGLAAFFREYSVLGRLLATKTDFWVEFVAAFLRRLADDWIEIERAFPAAGNHQAGLIPIANVEPGLSDPHHNGQTVIAVEFASGLRLVYKPKNVGVEAAFSALLDWLEARGLSPPLKTLRMLDRLTHGWVEFVERQPCRDAEQGRAFYQRAGMLLALFYALHGADYHHQNLIACGPHPVAVDHEMLMYPHLREDANGAGAELMDINSVQKSAYQQLQRSVLSLGLLPLWETEANGESYDISALGGVGEAEKTVRQLRWVNVNTDEMARVWQSIPITAAQMPNLPALDGKALSLSEHAAEVIAGFKRMYRFLVEHRQAILAPHGPLAVFAAQPVRFTFRKTRIYLSVLESALSPKYLRDGADFSLQLDRFSRALLNTEERPPLWPLARAEQAALAQLDIPRFTLHTDGHALNLSADESIEDVFSESGYALARARLESLGEADMERQVALIYASIGSWGVEELGGWGAGGLERYGDAERGRRGKGEMRGGGELPSPFGRGAGGEGGKRLESDSVVTLTAGQMVEQAVSIAETLEAHAIRSEGAATWVHLTYDAPLGRFALAPLGFDLYSGSGGVALFLAALSKISGDSRFRDLALAALKPLRQTLASSKPAIHNPKSAIENPRWNVGAATGLASMIYALVRAGQFLGEQSLVEDAQRAAAHLTPERVSSDSSLDIISGAAGAILGLLVLHSASPHSPFAPSPLELAAACGRRLLQARRAAPSGYRAWPTLEEKLLTGFSHGAAGIAYALLRLYAVSGEAALREAAEEGIAYERSVFSSEMGNWPDFRTSTLDKPAFMVSWCHGAPGIGLARLGGLSVLDTAPIREDIEAALKTTLAYGVRGVDHLCCGSLGRVEFLAEAAVRLARPELLETARQWTATIVAEAERAGGYNLHPPFSNGVCSPGFFQGLAGVGYTLLRLVEPERIPSALLWE